MDEPFVVYPFQPADGLHFDLDDGAECRRPPAAPVDALRRQVVALSVDSPDGHARWEKAIAETEGLALNFPVIADTDRSVSALYDMVPSDNDSTEIVRRVHVIDPDRRIRLMRTYPPATAYNFEAVLRAVEGLQLADARLLDTKMSDILPGAGVSNVLH